MDHQTNITDVVDAIKTASETIRRYLAAQGVLQTIDGFYAVALTGDEGREYIARNEAIYRPLAALADQCLATLRRNHGIFDELHGMFSVDEYYRNR